MKIPLQNTSTPQRTTQSSTYEQQARSSAELYISLAYYAFLVIASVTGNGLVIGAYASNKWLRTALTHTLIIGLACADSLVGFVSLPIWMYITFRDHKHISFSPLAYQFYITADIFIGSASIFQLMGISIERSHAVLRPLQHRLLGRRIFYIAVAAAWICSAALASLQPLQYGTDWQVVYTILIATVCFFIPTVVITIAYCSIFVSAKGKASLSKHQTHKKTLVKEVGLILIFCRQLFSIELSQKPICRSKQHSMYSCNRVFTKHFFIERIWLELRISFNSDKDVTRKSYRPKVVFLTFKWL